MHKGPGVHNGTKTSQAAAAQVEASGRAQSDRARVLTAITEAGERGLTRSELADLMGLNPDSVRPRVWELLGREGGGALVYERGDTRIPECGGGRKQAILRAF